MESIGSYKGAGVNMDGLDATELRLGLPGTTTSPPAPTPPAKTNKRPLEEGPSVELSFKSSCCSSTEETTSSCCNDHRHRPGAAPPAKAQVVGWPPVQSFRVRTHAASKKEATAATPAGSSGGLLVKVSMDGAPYLRKIDLGAYKGYKELRLALDAMFRCCFSPASAAHQQQSSAEHRSIMTYEDKDGDWMLVGDVPWEMFTFSCNRLRIMKGSCENRV